MSINISTMAVGFKLKQFICHCRHGIHKYIMGSDKVNANIAVGVCTSNLGYPWLKTSVIHRVSSKIQQDVSSKKLEMCYMKKSKAVYWAPVFVRQLISIAR